MIWKHGIFDFQRSRKTIQFKSGGTSSIRASVLALWGSKALENIVDLDLSFVVETEKSVLRRQGPVADQANDMYVGFIDTTYGVR